MKSKWMFLVTLVILASLLLTPAAPAFAQDEPPPPPASIAAEPEEKTPPDPDLLAQGLELRDGLWVNAGGMPAQPEEDSIEAQASFSKPDKYGYRYQKATYNWINVSEEGERFSQEQLDEGSTTRLLPFAFKFYGYTYQYLTIHRYGYATMGETGYSTMQSPLGNTANPNNVVAPNWQPLDLAEDYDGNIATLAGGVEPNRWYAVEWHGFQDVFSQTGNFTFEMVLFENGEMLFQYHLMQYPSVYACGASGIEDRDGLVYLNTRKFCQRQASYSAVKIVPPAASPRLGFNPPVSGKIGAPGKVIQHEFDIENLGDLGTDVFDLTYKGKWPATLYRIGEAAEMIPLTDTDSDKRVDTGPVATGDKVTIIAEVTIPAKSSVGSRFDSTVTATSSINKKKSKSITLENAVAAHFALTYSTSEEQIIRTYGETGTHLRQLDMRSTKPSVVETAGGRLYHFWLGCSDATCEDGNPEIRYSLYEHEGGLVRLNVALSEAAGGANVGYITNYGLAAGPYGQVGIAYVSEVDNILNVYIIVVDEDGVVALPPTRVTDNEVPSDEEGGPVFSQPRLALTPENTYVVTWRKYRSGLPDFSDQDRYELDYAILDRTGAFLQQPTWLPTGGDGVTASASNPLVTTLAGNKVLFGWIEWLRTGKPGKYIVTYSVRYQIRDNFGKLLYAPKPITVGEYAASLDATQTSNGEIILGWIGSTRGQRHASYAVLSGKSFKKTRGPSSLKYLSVFTGPNNLSITADTSGNTIFTWGDSARRTQFYALLGKGGAVKTKPMQYLSSRQFVPDEDRIPIYNNSNGNGNTTFHGAPRNVTVTLTVSVPKTTYATGKTPYLVGNFNDWNPAGAPMTRVDKTHWKITLVVPERYPLLYKYTLGDWESVEKGKKCAEINARLLEVQYGSKGSVKKTDTVLNWRNVLPCTGS